MKFLGDAAESLLELDIEKVRDRLKGRPARVNLPALARRDMAFMDCWKADGLFVSKDFTSLEPTITAELSQDPFYRYATYDGLNKEPYVNRDGILMIDDIYLMTASVMPGIGEHVVTFFGDKRNCEAWLADSEAVKDHPDVKPYRKKAKPACLGFNYGMGPKRFVQQCYDAGITVSLTDAKRMYKAYWDLFTGVKTLVTKLTAITKRDGYLVNSFGYRLTTEPHKGYNAMIQSSASGVLDVYNYKFFPRCPWAKFVALVHDEVIIDIPENRIEQTKKIQAECIESLNEDLRFQVPMRMGFIIGKTFAEIK